ncbi:ATP-dependent zinc protease family protein [Pseudoblastomonas halimionae]|uniref:ATP-dependent zinc protease n=1 Tax=Alteriqipengyuania halimionae TaxID=1926630 RepID=A0A6I4U116_9SPHN|nr:RimK/LysX family protein [Alteriqipengyuania halimionae]MXP09739.1 ATP-dependent zinc protease [Alteriqipengyuania halimionae]
MAFKQLPVVGWRELVDLPELGLTGLAAKIDSGARTSSLHGHVIEEFERDGERYVRFSVDFLDRNVRQICEAVHVDIRGITSSNGETQRRYVIKTPLRIGDVEFRAEISLADRSDMKFPMLIGRSSLRRRYFVDSGHSWLQTPGQKPVQGHKP